MSDTIQGGLGSVANDALKAIESWTEASLKVIPEKQYDPKDPRNILDQARLYACFFTDCHMYFQSRGGFNLTWQQFREACIANGAMNKWFTIADRDLMAKAAGHPELKAHDYTDNLTKRINDLIDAGFTVPFSVNGEHYMLIVGRVTYQGKQCFRVVDPGYQNDTMMWCDTLECFHDSNGPVYSKAHNGGHRKCTHIYTWEKK